MRLTLFLLVLFALNVTAGMSSPTSFYSRAIPETAVKGTIKDPQGNPLIGVNILEKGTLNGTVSDVDGNYSITVSSPEATLVFSYIGMLTQEVQVGAQTTINVTLEFDAVAIEEVVAVGYGTRKKVNLTGAVSSIKFDEVASSRPITNVSSALAGLSSGVYVRQSNGKPGSDGAAIRIRGIGTLNNSAPLIIIDGMEGVLDYLNPDDIESISILKDASSASIYGSRAANGVVLVTTKRGDNKRLSVTYSSNFSNSQPINLLQYVSDYPTHMRLMNESARNIGTAEVFSANTIAAWEAAQKDPNGLNPNGVPNRIAFPNTNWNDEMYNNSLVMDHNLSLNGGGQNARYLLSVGYLDNPGLVEATGFQRFTLRTNVEVNATKWLTVGTRTYATLSDTELGNYGSMLQYIRESTPGLVGRYNGKYGFPEAPEESATANNVYVFLLGSNGDNKSLWLNTTLFSKVQFAKGLSWDLNFNYVKRFDEYQSRSNPAVGERVKFSTGTIVSPPTAPSLLSTYYDTYSSYNYTLENLLKYETVIADRHTFNALAGYNELYFFGFNHNANKRGLFDESAYTFNSATEMLSIGGSATDWALRSWFGRLNYSFDDRYLLEANIRYDGSSRFHPDSRFGWFPSFAAAWRISEESFFKNNGIFDNLKLRASWGQLGNNASGDYDYQALYGPVGYSLNGVQVTGLTSGKIANQLLQWESTTVTNIGLDLSALKGRLTAEIDVYDKLTDGILTVPPIYLTLGLVGAPTVNTAEVSNRGLEVTLGWQDKVGSLNYSVRGFFGYNKNEVTKFKGKLVQEWRTAEDGTQFYYSNLGDVSNGGNNRILEGYGINEYYLMEVYKGSGAYFNQDGTVNINGGPKDGMIRTPDDMAWLNAMLAAGYQFLPNQSTAKNKIWYGDLIYADINGDKSYGNSFDRKFAGNSGVPEFTFGAQMNLSWKNIDLSMLWSGQAAAKTYWLESGYNGSNTRIGWQIGEMMLYNRYYYNEADPSDPSTNTNGEFPRLKLNQGDGQNTQASTYWLYDSSFLRLKNLTLGYSLSKRAAEKIFTQQVRVFFSAENLLTFTSFPGQDPEIGGGSNYPLLRQLSFGTNITF